MLVVGCDCCPELTSGDQVVGLLNLMGDGLFFFFFSLSLSSVSLNRSLGEVKQYLLSKTDAHLCSLEQTTLCNELAINS